jgi:hypothetical protein
VAKFILTDVRVMVNGVNLSDHAVSVGTPSTKEEVDVSGFSPLGSREFLPGVEDQIITVGFLQDYGTNSVHQTLEPLYRGGSSFPFYLVPDSDTGTSTSNPVYGGTAKIYAYDGLAGALNARAEFEATFRPAPGNRFAYGTTAIT